jgi:hypothetical protein
MKRGRGLMAWTTETGTRLVCDCIKYNQWRSRRAPRFSINPARRQPASWGGGVVNKTVLAAKRCMLRIHSVDIRTSLAVVFIAISQDCVRKTLVFEQRRGILERGFTNLHRRRGALRQCPISRPGSRGFRKSLFFALTRNFFAQLLAGPRIGRARPPSPAAWGGVGP